MHGALFCAALQEVVLYSIPNRAAFAVFPAAAVEYFKELFQAKKVQQLSQYAFTCACAFCGDTFVFGDSSA